MEAPKVRHEVIDADTGGKYVILAYDRLPADEVKRIVQFYVAHGGKRPKRRGSVEILWTGGGRR